MAEPILLVPHVSHRVLELEEWVFLFQNLRLLGSKFAFWHRPEVQQGELRLIEPRHSRLALVSEPEMPSRCSNLSHPFSQDSSYGQNRQ